MHEFYSDWHKLEAWERPIMLKNAIASRRFALVSVGLSYATLVFHLFSRPWVSMERQARTGHRQPLFESDFYFFDFDKSPEFELVWALQSFASLLASFLNSGFDSFYEVLVMHVCGQLEVLIKKIKSLNYQDDPIQCIACFAKRHHKLSRFDQTVYYLCLNKTYLFNTFFSLND